MTPKNIQTPQPMLYIGNGAFVPGIPARDLTADEWSALTAEQREQAASLYAEFKPVAPKEEGE